ncbi:hypothetical protein BJX61DRAFT_546603 [Aspergillus egyptiacus]|nr:hypothetical protein BJX61DRAFT_546603 [Aspergillus egyptiacus]
MDSTDAANSAPMELTSESAVKTRELPDLPPEIQYQILKHVAADASYKDVFKIRLVSYAYGSEIMKYLFRNGRLEDDDNAFRTRQVDSKTPPGWTTFPPKLKRKYLQVQARPIQYWQFVQRALITVFGICDCTTRNMFSPEAVGPTNNQALYKAWTKEPLPLTFLTVMACDALYRKDDDLLAQVLKLSRGSKIQSFKLGISVADVGARIGTATSARILLDTKQIIPWVNHGVHDRAMADAVLHRNKDVLGVWMAAIPKIPARIPGNVPSYAVVVRLVAWAARKGDIEMVHFILTRPGWNACMVQYKALLIAIEHGQVQLVQCFKNLTNFTYLWSKSQPLINLALQYTRDAEARIAIIAHLLERGADPNFTTAYSRTTALSLAITLRCYDEIPLLLAYGAGELPSAEPVSVIIPQPRKRFLSATLYRAAINGDTRVIQILLANGISPHFSTLTGVTWLRVRLVESRSELNDANMGIPDLPRLSDIHAVVGLLGPEPLERDPYVGYRVERLGGL